MVGLETKLDGQNLGRLLEVGKQTLKFKNKWKGTALGGSGRGWVAYSDDKVTVAKLDEQLEARRRLDTLIQGSEKRRTNRPH